MEQFTQPVEGQNDVQETASTRDSLRVLRGTERQQDDQVVSHLPHASQKLYAGRGTVGKTAVVGMKSRDTNQVQAECVAAAGKPARQGFVIDNTAPATVVYTEATLREDFSPVVDLIVI